MQCKSEFTQYGIDVAVRRIDDLDRALLEAVNLFQVKHKRAAQVLELGAGNGGLTRQLALIDSHVTAVDIGAYQTSYVPFADECNSKVTFIQQSIESYAETLLLQEPFNFVCIQRTLHYLPYTTAHNLLQRISKLRDCYIYVSVTGSDSAIGESHPARSERLTKRFVQLPESAQKTFSITAPLCVYQSAELADLLKQTGWRVERQWTSAFGNHKIIARTID